MAGERYSLEIPSASIFTQFSDDRSTSTAADSDARAKFEAVNRKYMRAAAVLANITEGVTGIPVPEKTLNNWRLLFSAIFVIDDRVDSTKDDEERLRLMGSVTAALRGEAVDFSSDPDIERAVANVQMLLSEIGVKDSEQFTALIEKIMVTTETLRNEENPREAVKLILEEGQLTSELLLLFLPEHIKNDSSYKTLQSLFYKLGKAGNILDSFVDIDEDFEEGISKVQPTRVNRVRFFMSFCKHTLTTIPELLRSRKKKILAREVYWLLRSTLYFRHDDIEGAERLGQKHHSPNTGGST